tara:strand:+ start:1659 stop:2585 length:927 start_codon:yes stop_codon:yes gene_type:complete
MKKFVTLNEEVSRVKVLMGLFEEEVISVSRETEERLVELFRRIAPKYARYLTILNFFDPYSLGTISEVILTKLLRDEGVDAENVGGSQGVTDIKLGDSNISLKTTKAGTTIGLGSDSANVSGQDIRDVAEFMNSSDFEQLFIESGLTLGEILSTQLQTQGSTPEIMSKTMDGLEKRIESIINKISGENNDEEFVWIEKVYDDDYLAQIIIHVSSYDRDKVRNEFYSMIPYTTGKSWGLQDENGVKMIQADSTAKKLNIKPAFIYKTTTEDKNIPIDIPVKDMKINDPKDYISEKMFDALDAMYRELFN